MAKLYFKVSSDVDKVIQLRQEIAKLKQELMSMDVNKAPAAAKALQVQIGAATQEFNKLTTEAAKAGAVMENDFKSKIYQGSQAVNDFTQKIINQKAVVKDVEADVRRLGESYRSALKNNPLSASGKLSEYTSAKKALDEEKASLFGLQTEQAQSRLSVRKLKDEYSLYHKEGQNVVDSNNQMAISFKKTLAVIGGTAAIKKFVSDVLRIRGEFQQLDVAFTTLLQSKEKANALMAQMVQTAAKTPFNLTELATGARQLVAYGFASEEVNGTLVRLGNIASGLGLPLERLTYLYGTTMTQGRLYARDLMQFTTSGIPMLQGLADMYGVSTAKVNEMVTAGKIGFPEVQKVIENLTNEGGKFFNLMEEQSKTITGKISNLGDAMDTMFNSIGQANEGVINDSIDGLKYLVENYEQVGRILLGLVATYGTYRAALILTNTYGIYDVATKNLQFAATMKNIVATNAMIVKQALLNSTMLANPFVLVTTLVVGAAAAMWALHDGTSEAEKAQERFNKRKEEASKIEQEHKQKIDDLLSSARDEALSTLTRQKSLEELRKEYPKIFAEYDIEKLKLADILKLKQQINEEEGKRKDSEDKKNLKDLEAEIDMTEKYLSAMSGKQGVDGTVKKLKELRLDRDNMLKDKGTGISEQFVSNLKNIDEKELKHYADLLQKKISGKGKDGAIKIKLPIDAKGTLSDEAIFDVKTIKALVDSVNSETKRKSDIQKADKKIGKGWLKDKKDDYDQAIKDLKAYENSKKELTKEEYEKGFNDKKEKVEITKKSYEDAGGQTSSQQKKESSAADKLREQQEKLALLMDKQGREQIRSEQDLQNQVDQSRIDAMKDGSTKTIEQMQLNHKKEMQQFEREKEDKLRKAIEDARAIFDDRENAKKEQNPKHEKKTFDASGVKLSSSDAKKYGEQGMYLDMKQFGETQALLDRDRQSWNEYLAEYGSFQEKKQAITAQYNEKIANASTEGEKASLKKELKGKQKDLNLEEIKSSINFADIFGNLDAQSTEALSIMRDKLKEVINKSANDLKPTDLKALQDAFTDIDLKISERNPFGELKQGIDDYKESTKSVIKAQEDLNTVQQGGEVIVGLYTDATGKVCKKLLTQEQAERNLSDAQRDRRESQIKLTESVNSIGEKGQQLVTAGSDITDMLTSLGVSIPESISGALDGIGQVMDSMASIDITKPMSIITGITGTLAGIGKAIGSIFGGSSDGTKVYEDMKEQLSAINEIYEKIIENSKEEIVFGGGFASVEAANNALDTYYKKVENYRRLADAAGGAGASVGSHSYAYRTNENLSGDWGNISRLIGKNISGIQDMYSLTGEQLYLIQTKMPDAWNKISSEIKNNLNAIIDCKDEAGELADALNAAMTGVDTDSFYNGFIDSLSDMDTSFEDMCDNFEGYLRKSIIAGLVASQYQGRIDSLYKKWSDAAVSDKKITEEESKALQDEYKGIVDDMMKDREDMANSFGWESSESSSQNSTKGMSQSMSQDTGDELNGRFTAFQISNEEIKNQNILQSQSLNLLTFKADAILSVNTEARNIADETRTILANSYLELVQISENTGESAKYLKDIKSDIAEVKRNTSRI